jgi:hypothetical protein
VNSDRIGIKLEDVRAHRYPERREDLRGDAEGEAAPLSIFEMSRQPRTSGGRQECWQGDALKTLAPLDVLGGLEANGPAGIVADAIKGDAFAVGGSGHAGGVRLQTCKRG